MDTVLCCEGVEKYYGGRGGMTKALDGVGFSVERGEFVGIMGPSGSGKTTLLNCIATLDSATAGRILVEGADVTGLRFGELARFRRERLGFIFQDGNLLDTLNARENIALPLTIARTRPGDIVRRVEKVAGSLAIGDVLDRFPYELSGGQQQRVAAARALVAQPALVLADEPTGALDSGNARLLLESLAALNGQLSATVLMVTHDPQVASYTRRVLFIKDGRLFAELRRGDASRNAFFDEIMDVMAVLGGVAANAPHEAAGFPGSPDAAGPSSPRLSGAPWHEGRGEGDAPVR